MAQIKGNGGIPQGIEGERLVQSGHHTPSKYINL
jgi:hypothetical protein